MRKKSKQRRGRRRGFAAFFVVLLLVIIGGIKLPLMFTESIGERDFGPAVFYRTARRDNAKLRSGELILVNDTYAYDFSAADKLYPIASRDNGSYRVKNDEISLTSKTISRFNALFGAFKKATGIDDVTIISAYRDYDYQQSVLDDYADTYGYNGALNWVARPGCSEHHTGMAADIAVADDDGGTSTFTGEGAYAYIGENAWKYGFINRYPADKTSITGISNEPWHYRYVGKVHAYVMRQTGMCLEEYESYLKNFTYGERYLHVNIHGDTYSVYYVPADVSGRTAIRVPIFGSSSISGNNMDGFVVTVKTLG